MCCRVCGSCPLRQPPPSKVQACPHKLQHEVAHGPHHPDIVIVIASAIVISGDECYCDCYSYCDYYIVFSYCDCDCDIGIVFGMALANSLFAMFLTIAIIKIIASVIDIVLVIVIVIVVFCCKGVFHR